MVPFHNRELEEKTFLTASITQAIQRITLMMVILKHFVKKHGIIKLKFFYVYNGNLAM